MKTFLSLSERMCLMKAQPVPMSAMVMNSSAPFRLQKGRTKRHQRAPLAFHSESQSTAHSMISRTSSKRQMARWRERTSVNSAFLLAHKQLAAQPTAVVGGLFGSTLTAPSSPVRTAILVAHSCPGRAAHLARPEAGLWLAQLPTLPSHSVTGRVLPEALSVLTGE